MLRLMFFAVPLWFPGQNRDIRSSLNGLHLQRAFMHFPSYFKTYFELTANFWPPIFV